MRNIAMIAATAGMAAAGVPAALAADNANNLRVVPESPALEGCIQNLGNYAVQVAELPEPCDAFQLAFRSVLNQAGWVVTHKPVTGSLLYGDSTDRAVPGHTNNPRFTLPSRAGFRREISKNNDIADVNQTTQAIVIGLMAGTLGAAAAGGAGYAVQKRRYTRPVKPATSTGTSF